jgi:hypothetical protein
MKTSPLHRDAPFFVFFVLASLKTKNANVLCEIALWPHGKFINTAVKHIRLLHNVLTTTTKFSKTTYNILAPLCLSAALQKSE